MGFGGKVGLPVGLGDGGEWPFHSFRRDRHDRGRGEGGGHGEEDGPLGEGGEREGMMAISRVY